MTVAAGVILAVGMLVFPALRDSREATRANICQNNLGEMFVKLVSHAENNGGYFPQIGPHENAGMFAVRLVEGGFAGADDLALLLVCPGSPAAQKMRDGELAIQLPTTLQLAAMSRSELMKARKNMSPCFAYTLPYRVGRQYVYRQDNRQPFPPILSDACGSEPGQSISPNHNGFFQALCGDGSVRVFVSCRVPGLGTTTTCTATSAARSRRAAAPAMRCSAPARRHPRGFNSSPDRAVWASKSAALRTLGEAHLCNLASVDYCAMHWPRC